MEAGGRGRGRAGKRKTVFCIQCSQGGKKSGVLGIGNRLRDTSRLNAGAVDGESMARRKQSRLGLIFKK